MVVEVTVEAIWEFFLMDAEVGFEPELLPAFQNSIFL